MKRVKEDIGYWCEETKSGKYLGQGIGVAVLDSGIAMHPDFDDRILGFHDVLKHRILPYDEYGHGTHICGVIGGNGRMSKGTFSGMAPRCNIYMVKILNQSGNGKVEDVMAGVRWILAYRNLYDIRVVNISIGAVPEEDDWLQKKLILAVEQMWDAGLVVVAAAGNYGPGTGSITIPGTSKKIITVGSSDDGIYQQRKLGVPGKNYSGRGPTKDCVIKPDVIAPGSYINSCNAFYKGKKDKAYVMKSGTSMATPVVSGAVAVLLSKYPGMTNVDVKLKLRESCDDMGFPPCQQGWGKINFKKLIV